MQVLTPGDIKHVLDSMAVQNDASCRSEESRQGFSLALVALAAAFGIDSRTEDLTAKRTVCMYDGEVLRSQRGVRVG
jgi:hypothetical protein